MLQGDVVVVAVVVVWLLETLLLLYGVVVVWLLETLLLLYGVVVDACSALLLYGCSRYSLYRFILARKVRVDHALWC